MRYEIRAMELSEILDLGFRITKDHLVTLGTIAGVIYVPLSLAGYFLQQSAMHGKFGAMMGGGLLMALLSLIAMPIVSAGITHALGDCYLGRTPDAKNSLSVGVDLLIPLIGTSLLAGLLIVIGFCLLVVPGVYLMLCYALIAQVIVLERTYGMAALSRSKQLTEGYLLRLLAIFAVVWLVMMVVGGGVQLILGFFPLLGAVASGVVQALAFAYSSAVSVIVYFDLRCRKEAFDLEHLAQTVESSGAGGAVRAR